MRNTILTLLMMIAVGVFASAHGRDAQTLNVSVVDAGAMGEPRVVLVKSGPRQQEAREDNEGCLVNPNGNRNQPKTPERDSSPMKGLVF